MPVDERTKETVRALPGRYPRGYVQEEAGLFVTNTAAGLFRLLFLPVLARDSVPSGAPVKAAQALYGRHWDSAPEISKPDDGERAGVLREAGYDEAEDASRRLGAAARMVLERYGGDLQNLRQAAGGDGTRLRSLLREIPGVDDAAARSSCVTPRCSGRRPVPSSTGMPRRRPHGSACRPARRSC